MAYDLSVSDRFELILMGVVFLNMIVLAVEFYEYRLPCRWVKVIILQFLIDLHEISY